MIKSIIIDDEEHARDLLCNSIERYDLPVEVIAKCSDVLKALEPIKKLRPDLVFLDIEMPNYSGFELLDFFREIDFEIIFVTAYSEYAVKAFEVSAIDYLLKPLRITRLEAAIKKVEESLALKNSSSRINTLKENLRNNELRRLALPLASSYQFIEIKDIVAVEAARAYCYFHLSDKRKILVSKSLNSFEEMLDTNQGFMRVHRSFLVNLHYIESYSKREQHLQMLNNLYVKISKTRKAIFEDLYQKFLPKV